MLTDLGPTLGRFLDLLEILLIVTTLLITTTNAVRDVIVFYRAQSLLLALVATLTAVTKLLERTQTRADVNTVVLIMFIALLPLLLATTVKPLLARATLPKPGSPLREELKMLLAGSFGWMNFLLHGLGRFRTRYGKYLALERDAEAAWIARKATTSNQRALLVFPVLLLIAFLVPFTIASSTFLLTERIGLAVSLTLHLAGLYYMTFPGRDIITQVVGLLVMDHGLYLAVVKIVEIPVPAAFFVISLYFYTAITIFILVILLPELRQRTDSIDRSEIARRSNLKR